MTSPRLRAVALGAALTLLIAACGSTTSPTPPRASTAPRASGSPSGSGTPAILPIPITGAFRVGDNRVVFTLTDATGQKQVAAQMNVCGAGAIDSPAGP